MEFEGVDPKSGYCSANSIYYSKHPAAFIPRSHTDLFTYLFTAKYGDQVAIIEGSNGNTVTYTELERTVHAVAAGLSQHLNIKKSDVVCILSSNSTEFEVLFLAIISLGAIMTSLNPLNTNAEIKKHITTAGAKCILAVPQLLGKTEGLNIPVVVIGDGGNKSKGGSDKPLLRYSDLLSGDPEKAPRVQLRQEDAAVILFSSGTTGASKGVVLTHGNLVAMASMYFGMADDTGMNRVVLHLIPMFHVFGLMISVSNLVRGTTVVMLPRFDLVAMLAAIQKYRITSTPVVPPILLLMIKQDVVLQYDMTSLRAIGCAAAPLGKELLEQCARRFPNAKLLQGYGLTESCGAGTVTPLDGPDFADHFGSCGVLLPNVEAMVVDLDTGKRMPPTQQGELWLRGPTVMREYLGNPEATAETVDKDGWLHTGDLVYFADDGYLYIVDRLKELIKYNANQVPPAELESLLFNHLGVEDCAVIPYPSEEAGEIPMAYIVRKPGSDLTAEEVMEYVAAKVAPYKKIRKVAFIDAIPKSPTGKVQRRELVALSRVHSKL